MRIVTVTGEISANRAGMTLMHEHILLDNRGYTAVPKDRKGKELLRQKVRMSNLGDLRWNPFAMYDNVVLQSKTDAISELNHYREAGGRTIVDVTTDGIGRNPKALKEISKTTGLNIICGSGYYVEFSHPPCLKKWSVERIAERIVGDLTVGIGDTGVRAGIIGEVGVLGDEPTEEESKSVKAAGRAQVATKAGLLFHSHVSTKAAPKTLDILEAEGADLNKVVVSHRDSLLNHFSKTERDSHYASIADRGAYIEFDTIGAEFYFPKVGDFADYSQPKDTERVVEIVDLINRGYASKLLLSHDVCFKLYLKKYGGYGWDHIPIRIVPLLERAGVSRKDIDTILVDNPRNILSI